MKKRCYKMTLEAELQLLHTPTIEELLQSPQTQEDLLIERAKHRVRCKAYAEKNKERLNKASKLWREKNKERERRTTAKEVKKRLKEYYANKENVSL